MDEKQIEKKEARIEVGNLPGDRHKDVFRWKDGRGSQLVKVGEVDLQKEVNEAARGMTAGEQITRILRGDFSGIKSGEGVTGDVTGFGDKTCGEVISAALAPMYKATATALKNNLTLEELEKRIVDMEKDLAVAKAAKAKEDKEQKENA